MRQGDAFPVLISNDGVDFGAIEKIEFVVGPYTKMYPGDVTYDGEKGFFEFPMSQTESMRLIGKQRCEARIKYLDGQVEGKVVGVINVEPLVSRTVI